LSLSPAVRRVSQKKGSEGELGRVSDPESGIWGEWDMGENLPSNLGLLPSTSNPLNPLNPDSLRVAALHSSLY